MTGLYYTNRLVDDINKSVNTRTKVLDPLTQIKTSYKFNINNFMASLDVTDVDAHLDILSQFLNINERLVNHNKGDKIDIYVFQHDVNANREAIANLFEKMLNKQLVEIETGESLSENLIQQLDWLHEAAN